MEHHLLTAAFLRLVLRLAFACLLPGIEAIRKLLQTTYVTVRQKLRRILLQYHH
jgi:hypothetical protein